MNRKKVITIIAIVSGLSALSAGITVILRKRSIKRKNGE